MLLPGFFMAAATIRCRSHQAGGEAMAHEKELAAYRTKLTAMNDADLKWEFHKRFGRWPDDVAEPFKENLIERLVLHQKAVREQEARKAN